ncbi:MAG: 3-deoxy-D-manno-octulosonic acid transferase [Lentisphaeria bacterium]|nr:3-deoxy-D-manno-octulosonic acid transferase [Lentisphaeria bacterium]
MLYGLYRFLYLIISPIVFAIYWPFYLRKIKKRGNYELGFGERFGKIDSKKLAQIHAKGAPIWVHAVSVGETVVALSFIETWLKIKPELNFVLSSTTSTGQEIARKKAPDGVTCIYNPIDLNHWVKRFFKLLKPTKLIIFEVEIWPNMIHFCKKNNIPLYLLNGRLSDNSAKGFKKHRAFFGPLFENFTALGLQTDEDLRRIKEIAPKANSSVLGNMKFDQLPLINASDVNEILKDTLSVNDKTKIFCAASTHAPEEAMLLNHWKELKKACPNLKFILVPRHHERGQEVASLMKQNEITGNLITDYREKTKTMAENAEVLIVNTTGELMNFMASSDYVFVGKSLADFNQDGGHNIIEPALLGKPVIHGPEMQNFRDIVRIFDADKGAWQVNNIDELVAAITKLYLMPDEATALAKRALAIIEKHKGGIARSIEMIEAGDKA